MKPLEEACFNKYLFMNEGEWVEFVLSLQDRFYCIEKFEEHFQITAYDEELEPDKYDSGEVNIATMQLMPERYPCLYVCVPFAHDYYGGKFKIDEMFDEFVYLDDFLREKYGQKSSNMVDN